MNACEQGIGPHFASSSMSFSTSSSMISPTASQLFYFMLYSNSRCHDFLANLPSSNIPLCLRTIDRDDPKASLVPPADNQSITFHVVYFPLCSIATTASYLKSFGFKFAHGFPSNLMQLQRWESSSPRICRCVCRQQSAFFCCCLRRCRCWNQFSFGVDAGQRSKQFTRYGAR